jgi:hypothetical protein
MSDTNIVPDSGNLEFSRNSPDVVGQPGLKYSDGVAQVSFTSGTGDYTLSQPLPDSFLISSVLISGDSSYFDINMPGGPGREIILGTFTSPDQLARTEIIKSSNNNMPVDWPSSGQRFVRMIRKPSNSAVIPDPTTPGTGALPSGGDCRFVLTKKSGDDFDVDWEGVPVPLACEYVSGTPGASQRYRISVVDKLVSQIDFAGSIAWAGVEPMDTTVVVINRITPAGDVIQIGTVTFTPLSSNRIPGSADLTFTTSSPVVT